MNLLGAWKKVLLFGLCGAAGCLAGWAVGEGYLAAARAAAGDAGAAATLITKPVPASSDPPPLPSEFRDRLDRAGARSGDIQISLIWFNTNDLDLHCVDPKGVEIFFQNPRSPTGGHLDVDRNAGCERTTAEPVENIYWPAGGAPMGHYKVYLNYFARCPGAPDATEYKINVLHGGERREFRGTIAAADARAGKRLIYEFELAPKVEVFAPTELTLGRGATARVPVAVRRTFFGGELKVRAENLPDGVTAVPGRLAPGINEGTIELRVGDAAAAGRKPIKLVATGAGVSGAADPQLEVTRAAPFSLASAALIGVWTALLAVGLCLALLAGQNTYLRRPPLGGGAGLLAGLVLGAVAAGFVSGSVGQGLYSLLLSAGVGSLGFVVGWVLLGGLLGLGVSLFVPNLDRTKAVLAGLAGGLLGAVAYLAASNVGGGLGRLGGAAALGFCIGLVVAIVEAAFRRAWLEVRFGGRETITVNLGPEPVKVGGDARLCTVWARGAPDVALRYFVRDGRVVCEDVPARTETTVGDGDVRTAGTVTLTVRTGTASAPGDTAPRRPAAPPPRPEPEPVPARPEAAKPAAPPPPAAMPVPDFDDGLPMPIGPPPPPRPKAASILDADPVPAARGSRGSGAGGSSPPAPPRPPVPAPATAAAKPPAPPRPPAPAAPPPNPAAAKPAADAGACPTCGRKSPGRPGDRYCVLCDKTY
jgi:hypothetical protein